jgi:5-methylcytosine-specific restriction endonuclease McrA
LSTRKKIALGIRQAVLEKSGYKCVYCGSLENLQVDHITPVARGGSDDISNLQTLCSRCNSNKGASLEDDEPVIDEREIRYYAMIPESLIYDHFSPANAVKVYGALDRHMNKKTRECFPGQRRIAELTGIARSNVQKCLGYLEKRGYLKVERNDDRPNHYHLMPVGGLKEALPEGTPGLSEATPAPGEGSTGPPGDKNAALHEGLKHSSLTKENKQSEDPEKTLLLKSIKAFTDAWVKEYPEAHATIKDGVKQTAPYSFAGSKDRQSAERIVKACQACTPQVDPMDLARFVWTHPKYARGKGFLGAMGKSIAVLSSGINEALDDMRSRGSAGRHAPAEDYEGRVSDAKA